MRTPLLFPPTRPSQCHADFDFFPPPKKSNFLPRTRIFFAGEILFSAEDDEAAAAAAAAVLTESISWKTSWNLAGFALSEAWVKNCVGRIRGKPNRCSVGTNEFNLD